MAELTTPTKPKAEDSKKMETPSKKQKRNSIVCSITNVSDLLLSPNKGRITKYINFGTITESCNKMCRSVSFDPNHYEYLKSEEMRDVVNNPLKAIEIFDYQED